MSLAYYLQKIHVNQPLSESEAAAACEILMGQEISTAAAGAYLMALAQRSETMEELVGMAQNLRKRTSTLVADTACCDVMSCSTTDSAAAVILGASLLLTTAGVPIAKLLTAAPAGNTDVRSIATTIGLVPASSPTNAADMLTTNGFALLDPADYTELLRSIRAHQESLPIPTVFDRLMALSHPAKLQSLLLGVGPKASALPVMQALRRLRIPRAIVLATENSTCPFSHAGPLHLVEMADGRITQDDIQAADFGFDLSIAEKLADADTEKQGAWLRALIDGRDSPLKGPVIWATALGLVAAGKAATLPAGIDKAKEVMTSGRIAGVVAIVSRGSKAA